MRKTAPKPVNPCPPSAAFTYTARDGSPWFLHQGVTKTGKPRLFLAKERREGAIPELPPGFEIVESINGVVSVARTAGRRSSVPPEDVEVVRTALRGHPNCRFCDVDVRGDAIIIHEPLGGTAEAMMGLRLTGRRTRYDPVMMFEHLEDGKYGVSRMVYRGAGGWHMLSSGPLRRMLATYLPHIGKESFFELM